ncbi:GH3 auxin-responsive promoter family protein [Collimonas pratensis]|uniref:GH3 auxin-responsive promoter family protein n=1 Tax=Collimonas pratensis TaxID=279113 RepID=A0A127Q4I5_9BURK|nr:GH3 auxin-responsive promoter family protein [Collimonas pratensis]
MLADNSESAFGRAHGFARISDPVQFRERVPIHTYADLLPWIERAQRETQPVLTAQSPRFFERTSGNSAQQKLIPYTQTFLDEIQVALTIWLADLYRCLPAIAAGRAYWSMSPPMQPSVNALNGIPIGSESDLDYLGGSLLAGLAATLIIPPFAQEASAWRAQTLLALVAAEDLSLISVWSPTFLTSLLRPLFDVGDPAHVGILALLDAALPPSRKSALRQTLTTGMCDALWPRLAAVSCWMDGPSRNFATQLQARFPHALWLPKGLFATEGVVSLPYGTGAGCPLAIESHFLEFLFDDGSVHDAASLRPGDSAQIILTTGGGLYRYALGDRVRVAAMSNCTPRIEFVGRSGVTSDLVGEKLDEDSVASILSSILASSDSACLVPCVTAVRPHYVLLVASGEHCNSEELRCAVERALEGSFHYAHARRLEQLGPLRIRVLTGSSAKLADALQQAAEQSGIRAGDVKPRVLINRLTTANALLALTDT